jgi:hypothetical protein
VPYAQANLAKIPDDVTDERCRFAYHSLLPGYYQSPAAVAQRLCRDPSTATLTFIDVAKTGLRFDSHLEYAVQTVSKNPVAFMNASRDTR